MAKKSVMIADDLSERSQQGRLRSRLLRDSAVELAKKLKLEIDLLYVKNINPSFLDKKQIEALENSFEDIAAAAMTHFKKASIKGRIHLRAGSPPQEILTFAEVSSAPEIMVMGTHGKKGLTKMILGSVAEEVLRHAKIPVMILGPAAQEKQNSLKITKDCQILLMTDLTPASAAAEEFALKMAEQLKCPLTVLHSVGDQIMKTRTTLYGSGYVPFDMDKMFKELTDDAQATMDRKVNAWAKKGLEIHPIISTKEEAVEKTFLTQARKDHTFAVMGTHGRSNFLTAFIGSAARKALLTSPIPVFVVRSKK